MRKNGLLIALGGFLGSALLLTVIQPPLGWSWAAWGAYVPMILVSAPRLRVRTLILTGYVVGAAYWLASLWWVKPVTWQGWLAFCLYTGVLWPVLSLCVRYCRGRRWPLVIVAPVLIVGVEQLQGLFLGGFYWRFLAHSQYRNISIIQIADVFGAAGVSFLIAAVNGLIAEWLLYAVAPTSLPATSSRRRQSAKTAMLTKSSIVAAAVVASLFYGRWRVAQTDRMVQAGPPVGVVQSNTPQSVKETFQSGRQIIEEMLELSQACAKFGADLIIWPETMVQAVINREVVELIDPNHESAQFDRVLSYHAAQSKANLLVGAYAATPRITDDRHVDLVEKYNSAILYDATGRKADQRYDKIHLVPFGEVIPFQRTAPWLYGLLMWFTPYTYDYSLSYGTEYTIFDMNSPGTAARSRHRFAVMICYEDTVPAIARRFALDDAGRKHVDWLVNVSNDGWFVQLNDDTGQIVASIELLQHVAICAFRAVENRLAVVRSVNSGISCVIDSAGRIRDGFEGGSLPDAHTHRTAVKGWLVDRMPVDPRVTVFSKWGQWLDFCCKMSVWAIIILPALFRWLRTRKGFRFTRTSE